METRERSIVYRSQERVKLGLDTLDYVPQEESDHEMIVPEVPRSLKLPQYRCQER